MHILLNAIILSYCSCVYCLCLMASIQGICKYSVTKTPVPIVIQGIYIVKFMQAVCLPSRKTYGMSCSVYAGCCSNYCCTVGAVRMQNCIKCVKIFCMTRLSKNLHRLGLLDPPHTRQKIKQEKRIERNNAKNSQTCP